MFEMISNGITNVTPPSVMLRCECGNITYTEATNLETANEKYCVLKDDVTVICPKCGKSQSAPDKYIPKETEVPAYVAL